MRHFHRTTLHPDAALETADSFFPTIGLRQTAATGRARTFRGIVGTPEQPATLELTVRMEGGHYTFVEANTDQMGESRLDRNVKKYFVLLHQQVHSTHSFAPAY